MPANTGLGLCLIVSGFVVSVEEDFSHLTEVPGHTRAVALTLVLQGGGMCLGHARTIGAAGASWRAQHGPEGCGRAAGPRKNTGSVKKPIHPVCLNSKSANAVLSAGWKQIFDKWD